ncbi:MAG TPA: O-antigen ligase family protein [Flavobacterium sp.]|uniref:O-antigen ligase family protein n=1 Tax=Flavobacterium sp. TaxID=239 RepID=UPI002C4E2C75|nr:O-antigen ligase family protein [Flavobacterium sp.]HSD14411.1 O-antigen ligase family protein [Flavobacterium sp.]
MKKGTLSYTSLVFIHIGIGLIVYLIPFLAKIYSALILVVGLFYVMKTRNRNNEALFISAYLVGAEVFLRMTDGNPFHEMIKYSVIVFMIMGMVYSGISKGSLLFWFYMFFLLPGVLVATETLNFGTDIRKAIMFNLSGPLCLGFAAIYCYRRKISLEELNNLLLTILFPIFSALTFVFLYNPSIKEVVTNTASNFETSGGFGPNQVATILGLGTFILVSRIVLKSKGIWVFFLNVALCILMTFRGIVTFSRGGMMTAAIMIVLLLLVLFFFTDAKGRFNIIKAVAVGIVLLFGVWLYSSSQTSGLIERRYANEGVHGNKKASQLSGREDLISSEIKMFLDNPIFGIGVGKNKEYREETTGIVAASHNEITRMLAEHGSFGLVGFLILLIVPLLLYLDNKMHIYMLSFYMFWLLTLNHAAMRTAAPAFIYALTLLKIYALEKPAVHRE